MKQRPASPAAKKQALCSHNTVTYSPLTSRTVRELFFVLSSLREYVTLVHTMNEHIPSFDRSPFSDKRARSRSRNLETTIMHNPTPKTESQSLTAEQIEDARRDAERIATNLKQTQTELGSTEPTILPYIKPSFIDRLRNFFGIPKSISAEIRGLDPMDVKAVDDLNADITRSPIINRKSGRLSRALLLGTTLGAIGVTHEPQIERGARIGIEVVKDFEHTVEAAFNRFTDDAIAFIARNNPFGKETYTGAYVQTFSDAQKNQLKKFSKKYGVNFSKEQEQHAMDLIERVKNHGNVEFREFFLEMEMIHGQITKEQNAEAHNKLNEITNNVRDRLTAEERKSSIRVAFELAKFRKTYAREKSDLYSMTMAGEGNCEALVRFLLATVPDVAHSPQMAVQIYSDHVRFLVRDNINDPWEWIDGKLHGVLTAEELKGTLIMDPIDMIRTSLGLMDRVQKNSAGDPIPEKNIGFTTNSMLRWETNDRRMPSRAASEDGIYPERVDESKNDNLTFEQGARAPRKDHARYIEVSPDFYTNSQVEAEQDKDGQEVVSKEVRLAPKEKDLAEIVKEGIIYGMFNDLSTLTGINLNDVVLGGPLLIDINAARDVDLSPLKDSQLRKISLSSSLEIKGADSLNVKNVEEAYLSVDHEVLWKKIVKESISLKYLELFVPVSYLQTHKILLQSGSIKRLPGFEDIIAKFAKQKFGLLRLVTNYTFEHKVDQLIWKYDGATGDWTTNMESPNGMSLALNESLEKNKQDPSNLIIPCTVTSLDYLRSEHVNLDKIETVVMIDPIEGNTDEDWLAFDVNILKEAKKMNTIYLVIDNIPSVLDLSALNDLSFNNLVIETDIDQKKFTIVGLDKNKVRITFKAPEK